MRAWSYVGGCWQQGEQPDAAFTWYIVSDAEDRCLDELAARFHLHPLAIEDCRSTLLHAPKIDEFADHLFVVFLSFLGADPAPRIEELDVFLGANFLITYSDRPLAEVRDVEEAIGRGIALRPGADGLLYELVDRVVDATLPRVSAIGEQLDAFEHDALGGPSDASRTARVVELRSGSGRARRLLQPEQAVLQRLSRGEFSVVLEANRIYFRDIYDHLVRIDLAFEGVREDAEVVLSTYLAALNNRMNEVMKVLSMVAALALPATVITGIFGTNFESIPGLHSEWSFGLMLAAMLGIASGMAYFFHRRRWF